MTKTYTIKQIKQAECNLEPLKCPACGKHENTVYNQYGQFASCMDCGKEWE